jgi:hypothetical protein
MNTSHKSQLQFLLGPVVTTLIGLLAVVLVGLVSWSMVRGITGIAGGLGAMIACYFAIASAELFPPGSIESGWKGGLYGAAFGVPVAAVLSPLALNWTRKASSR